MPITFLDEEEGKIAPITPTKRKITFLDEEEADITPTTPQVTQPEITQPTTYKYDPNRFRPKGLIAPKAEQEIGTLEGISNAAKNAFDSSRQALDIIGDVTPEEAQNIAKIEFNKQSRKVAPGYDEYQKAQGFDAVLAFAKNPIEVTSNIIAEGLAGSLPALGAGLAAGGVGAAAGSVVPVLGTGVGFTAGQIAGTFAGSLATEYGSKILEEMQSEGVDLTKPESIQGFFENEEAVNSARDKAIKRGIPVAAFDAISAGIGGKLSRVIGKQFLTNTGEAAAELAVQAGLGGGGEVAGALAAGEPIEGKAVFGEIIGEVGPGAVEVVAGRIADRAARVKSLEEASIKVAAEISDNLEQNNAPLTAAAVKSTSAATIEQDKLAAQLAEQLDAEEISAQVEGQITPTITPEITPAVPTAQPTIEDATQEIIQPEGVREEPQDRVEVRPTPETGVSDSILRAERGEEEGQVTTTVPAIPEAITRAIEERRPISAPFALQYGVDLPSGWRYEDDFFVPPATPAAEAATPEPIISEIQPTSELVGEQPAEPTIREFPEIPQIVGAEPAAIVEQEPVTQEAVTTVTTPTVTEAVTPAAEQPAASIPTSGKPFEFFSIRNKEKAPRLGTQFGQDVEPSGKYISQSTPDAAKNLDARFEKKTVRFENPLVIEFGGEYGTATNWKNVLSSQYGGKTGKQLSQAIRDAGYDGIVTVEPAKGPNRPASTSEIVDISSLKPKKQIATPTPAAPVEPAAEPAGISVGNRIKLGKSPQTYTIEEVIPQSATERELGEQYYSVKNERTGETQVVEARDLRQVKGKGARKIAASQMTPATQEEIAAFNKASSNKVMARNPQLAVAAVRLKNGKITASEYADLIDSLDPFNVKGAEAIPAKEKIDQYIDEPKLEKVNAPIQQGKEVEFRIDIPTYNRSTAAGDTVYAVTAHEPVPETSTRVGTPISYLGVAKVINPKMMTRSISGKGEAIDIATGAGKFPLATVKGNYEAITELPTDINDPNVWTEVSYNPIRSSYFVDVRSKNAVVGGDEAIMVGSRVFVKNPQMQARPTGIVGGEGVRDIRYISEENILTTPPDQQYTFEEVFDVAYDMFGGEIPEGFAIVNDSTNKDFEFKAAYVPESGEIIVNLAYLNKSDDIRDAITHELGHYIYGDPEFRAAFDQFIASLSPEARADLDAYVDTAYNKETGEIRLEEKMVRAFVDQFINEEQAPMWRTMLDAIKRFMNKLGFKFNISDRDAISVFTAALDRYKAEEFIPQRGAIRRVSEMSKMDADYLAAVERGDMETAQRMVDEAAKKAGYIIAAGHATPFNFNVFDRAKISDADPDTIIRGFFFSTEPKPSASYVSGLIDRGERGDVKIINAYLKPGITIKRSDANKIVKQQLKNDPEYQEQGYSTNLDLYFPKNANTVEFVSGWKLTEEKKRKFEQVGEIKEGNAVLIRSEDGGVDMYREADDYGPREFITGYLDLNDAYSQHSESQYIVKDSNQIKSADPVTYDDAGDVIPLSQRFRPTSPDIRRMAAEPAPKRRKEQVGGAEREETRYITTPKGILSMNTEVLREKFFDGTSVSPEKTTQAWGYISRLLDIKSGNANEFAGEINDTVDADLLAKREAAIAAGEKVDPEEDVSKRIGAAMFSVELMNYAGRLAEQGDTRMLKFMIRNVNSMPTDKYAGDISDAARALRTRLEYDVSGFSAYTTEQKAKVDRTAAVMFGTNKPTEQQSKAVKDALDESEKAELGSPEEVAEDIQKIEKRTGKSVVKKIDEKINASTGPKKEELLISFQNLNQERKFSGINIIYKPQKIDPAKNIEKLITGNLVDYRKTLIKKGADGLESTFWQTMSSKERKPGPLGEIDQAQNNELAKIVQKTLIDLGLKGEPPNTKMTDIEKVASILNKQLLSEEKKIAADKKIVEEIERRRSNELEISEDTDAVNAKYDSILNAWNEAMSRQTNMPISDNMLQRLVNSELKEQGSSITDLINEPSEDVLLEKKNGIVDSIIRRIYGVSKEFETGIEISEDYDNLSRYLKQTLENMLKLQAEKRDAAVARTLQRGVGDLPPLPETQKNKVQSIVQQDLRQQPDMGRRDPWKNMLTGKLIQAGVSQEQAENIANLVWRQHEINDNNRKIKEMNKAAEKGSLAVIIDRIKTTPLEAQQAKGWKEEVIKDYLRDAGLSSQAAETAAKLYDSIISERFAAAKQKAFDDSIKKAAPWKDYLARNSRLAKDALKKIQEAIRTGALDPEKNVESIIAEESGWSGFTKDQYQRIVQLDSVINDSTKDDVTRREAMADLNKIIADAKLPVRFKDALGAYYVGNALMGIPTLTVNIASPIGFTVRNLMTDISKYAFTDPARIPVAFETFMESMRSWYDQTSYAFRNQIYLNDVVEYLQGQNVLRELFDKGKKQWAQGKYAEGFVNMAVGMTQITGRVLSSLDQGAISMLENQNITRYALEALANAKGKVPKDKLKEFANMVIDTRRKTIAENIANGMSRDRAGVLADLAVKSEVISALAQYDVNPMNVLDASINDALQSVGRNKTLTIKGIEQAQKNLSDEGFLSYWPIKLLEMVSAGAGREGSSMQVFAKMLYGFALVPARVFHNVAWFSPYGFIRLGIDKYKKNQGEESPYAMSLQTEAQYKQRLTEAIAGSVAMLGLAALSSASSDEDDDKKFKIVITGNGPSATTDKQYFDSWMKKWKPYSVHIVVNGNIIPINIGRGGEALFFPIMLAGALDDFRIKQKQNLTKKEPEDLSAIAQMLGSSFFALAQRGPYAAFTKPLFDASKDGRVTEELASQIGFFGKTFIPVLGSSLARNISDLLNDPVDRSSIEGAIYANTPVVGPWIGTKALNALGQPIRADDWGDRLFKLGVPVVFSFPKNTPENALNELILKQGSGPTIPTRANAQKRFGDVLTDKEFETYVREYGRVMSDKMFKNRTKLESMNPSDYDDELEKYARGYSIDGIKIKGASDSAVLAVKRMRQ